MSGLELDQSTISSSRRSLECQISGPSYSKSKFQLMNTSNRMAFGVVAGTGDAGVKLAAW